MVKQLPTLHPLAKIGLDVYLTEIEATPFVSREYSVALPEIIRELLRIESEVQHDTH